MKITVRQWSGNGVVPWTYEDGTIVEWDLSAHYVRIKAGGEDISLWNVLSVVAREPMRVLVAGEKVED